MIKVGMIIGDRYEIIEKIGTGGMSDVYKAKCHKLNRFVAIKVLKQEFSENANFVSKFRVEAQAAAGLMHPNIVNVYDVGEENGIYYIVMELVEGITLKKYIEKKARISVKEAISIAIQVSMGIEAAHNNHIIHRDIKPQNIIISKEGKVKVTDFGIAKAATSNTITSNVMGSVHYTSPEQARGGYSDERSDIYSLGITLFEMLTGRVPFNGETTVAIAIKHIQEPLPSPREFVSEIPVSVEQIVFKCCQKSPDRRYQTIAGKAEEEEEEEFDPEYDPKMERVTTILTIVAAIIIGCIIFFLVGKTIGVFPFGGAGNEASESASAMVLMPDVEGSTLNDAKLALTKVGLIPEIQYVNSDQYPADTVISADVKSGESVASGNRVVLTVSSGNEGISVPSVVGKTYEEGETELKKAGFTVTKTEEYAAEVKAGKIISQSPEAGQSVPEGSAITLHVSLGTEDNKVQVPNLLGKEEDEAMAVLTELGLVLGNVEYVESTQYPENQICYQSYTVDSYVDAGTLIDVKISLGEAAATYSYSGTIQGPTLEEDPGFKSGTSVQVTIIASNGTVLMDMATTSFPFSVNYSGIRSETGKVTFHYFSTAEDGSDVEKTIERPITFTKEN